MVNLVKIVKSTGESGVLVALIPSMNFTILSSSLPMLFGTLKVARMDSNWYSSGLLLPASANE